MSDSTEVSTVSKKNASAFSDIDTFKNAQRMAGALCQSSLVPSAYQNNVPNTMVAMEMAIRIGISPLMVMQNLDIIQGKPSWRSSFIISALNSCGRFKPLRFEKSGEGDDYGYNAYAYDLETKEKVVGPKVTWKMVKHEGWLSKKGSKWASMPELMFQYRAASFFGRLFAPDILTGMQTAEEVVDVKSNKSDNGSGASDLLHAELKSFYEENDFDLSEEDRMHIERVIDQKETLSYVKALDALTLVKK